MKSKSNLFVAISPLGLAFAHGGFPQNRDASLLVISFLLDSLDLNNHQLALDSATPKIVTPNTARVKS